MGLFDGLGGGNTGILGGLPDWLLNAQAGQDMPMNFADRYANVPPMQNSGMMADPGLQQVSPDAMQAWRQGADQGALGGAQMPPMAQPVSGQAPPGMPTPQPPQGGQMPSALNGLPVPGMPSLPSMPSFGGSAQAQGLPGQTQPGIGDRLSAGFQGFLNGGGVLPAIGNLIGGLATGQRQDSRGYMMQQTQQAQQAAYQAVKAAGGSEGQAIAAATNPEVFKALAPDLFGAPKVVQTSEDMYGAKQFQVQQGNKFSPIPGNGAAGGSPVAAAGGGAVNHDLAGEAYLAQFPPEVQAAVKDYLSGNSMPTGNPRKGFTQAVKMIAQKYGSDIGMQADDTSFGQRRQLRNQLSSGGASSLGGQVNAGNTAIGHLADMSDSALKLNNMGTGPLGFIPGSAMVAHGMNMAGNSKGDNAANVNAFNDIRQRYVEEITRFYSGGPGAQAERERALSTFDAAKTPKELASAIAAEGELMHSKLSAIKEQVKTSLGDEGLKKYPIVSPKSEDALQRINQNVKKLNGETASPNNTQAPTRQLNGKSYYKQNGKWFEGNPPGDTSIPANANFTEGQLPEDSPIRMAMMDSPRSPRPKPQLADQFGGGGGTATSPPGGYAASRAEINKKAFGAVDSLRRQLGVDASTPGGRATDQALKAIEDALGPNAAKYSGPKMTTEEVLKSIEEALKLGKGL